MSDKNWENIKELFNEALELAPKDRDLFLEKSCDDQKVREEVRQLLNSFDEDEEFLESTAVSEVADVIVGNAENNLVGKIVGRYKIKSLLGEGGMGKVFLAKDSELERFVAVKILSTQYSADDHRVNRFFQEAKSASALNHPNILTIHEIGSFEDTFFIATEYVKGETLRQRQNRKRLSPIEILDVSIQIVSALKAAHEANIIHRDIKPENIMIREDGLVKILDFGLAKLIGENRNENDSINQKINLVNTAPRVVLGTVAYMSPEQARGKQTDFRTDIWSFGVCLYELITGFAPFKGETMSDQIAEILTSEPPPLDAEVSIELSQIVSKTLQKNIENRYQNAKKLFDDLTNYRNLLKINQPTEQFTSYRAIENTVGNRFKTVVTQFTSPIISRLRLGSVALISILTVSAILAVFGVYNLQRNSIYKPNPEAVRWFQSGIEAARNGNNFKAKKMLEQAVQIDNKYLPAHAKLAEVWMQLDYEDKAAQSIFQVTELIPQLRGLSENDEIYLQAVIATVRRDYKSALTNYEKVSQNASEEDRNFALFDVGRAFENIEDFKSSKEVYEEIVRRDPQFVAAYLHLANIYWFDDQREKALQAFEKASAIYTARSDYDGLGELYYLKGTLYGFYEELPEATKNLEKSLEIAKATNNPALQVKTTLDLGGVKFALGENTQAKELIDNGLLLARNEQLEYFTTNGLIDLGTVYYLKGEYADAEKYLQQALQLARVNGGKKTEARALFSLGSISLLKNKPREAISYIEPALRFYDENNFKQEKAKSMLSLGIAYDQTGRYNAAFEILNQLNLTAKETDDSALIAQIEEIIGQTFLHKEEFSEALKHFEASLNLNKSLERDQYAGYSYFGKAQVFTELGQSEEAGEMIRTAERLAIKSEDKQLQAFVILQKAQKSLSENDFKETIKQSQSAIQKSDGQTADITISANLLMSLAELRSGNSQKAGEYFEKSSEMLEKSENPRISAEFQLTKAEILLKNNDANGALSAALTAKEFFTAQNLKKSEWMALTLASTASSMIKDAQKAESYSLQADTLSNLLKKNWGSENFQHFYSRKDIKFLVSRNVKADN